MSIIRIKNRSCLSFLMTVLLLLSVSSCSTTQGVKHDPLEPMNRAIYKFNEVVDDVVLKPIAKTYKAITPDPVETGVSNFFNKGPSVNKREFSAFVIDFLSSEVIIGTTNGTLIDESPKTSGCFLFFISS